LSEAGRYQIHPLLRQYAAEKLASVTTEAAAVAQKHAAYYLDFLAAQGSGEETAQRAAILADLPNVRAAWLSAAGRQELPALARVAATLHGFYSMQSWFQAGIDTFQQALDTAPSNPTPEQARALCELWSRLARLRIHVGQIEAARRDLQQALLHLAHVNSLEQRATIAGYLAITTYYAGDYEQAETLAAESLQAAEAAGDGKGIAFALNFLGSCAKAQGDYDEASRYFERAVTAYRQNGDQLGAAMVLNNLGNLAQASGRYEAAQGYYEACTALFKTLDHSHGAATTLANWGRLALKLKEYDKAGQLLQESLALKQAQNDERGVAIALVGLGALAVEQGAYDQAGRQLAQALILAQKSGDVKTTLEGMVAVAALRWRQGDTAAATYLLSFILQQKGSVQEVCQQAEDLAAQIGNFTPIPTSLSLEELTAQLLAELPR
jgi:tetratricopeptide (TPR) repeat protein